MSGLQSHTVKVLLVVILLALAIYFVVRALDTRGVSPRTALRNRPGPAVRRRPVAPDDDEEFLSSLNRHDPGETGPPGPTR